MSEPISAPLRHLVTERATGKCEYCQLSQEVTLLLHHVDHVISLKHRGKTKSDNLALACADCNWAKGSDIASLDPETEQLTFFYHPRMQRWDEHFQLINGEIHGLTPEGRATVLIFQFNEPERLAERQALQQLGLYP